MGSPQFSKKTYETPKKPYDSIRLKMESDIEVAYGLRSKKEIWKAQTTLRNYRQQARRLLALHTDQGLKESKEIIEKLKRLNILQEGATLDDILGLKLEDFLERRLQTVVYKRGMANTPKQARQFIIHGNISVNGRKITAPGYVVNALETEKIEYYKRIPNLREESDIIEIDNAEGLEAKEVKAEEPAKVEPVKEVKAEEPAKPVKVEEPAKVEPVKEVKVEEPAKAEKAEVEPVKKEKAKEPETATKEAGD